MARRAENEFRENLRNELYVQENELAARQREKEAQDKKDQARRELQEAKDFQMRLKAERAAEEKRLEEDFKNKLLAKFAEDERLEQMAQQKRRMRELEHRREVERLWQEKLVIYREQRAIELAEREAKMAADQHQADIIEQEKQRLLAEHAAVLQQHHPKAANQYRQ